MSLTITPAQNKRMHFLLNQFGIDADTKAEIVSHFTNGRTTHSREMEEREATQMNRYLQDMGNEDSDNKMRRKIISLYRTMGYEYGTFPTQRADMVKIKASLKEHWKKDINGFTRLELTRIISVLEEKWLPDYRRKQALVK